MAVRQQCRVLDLSMPLHSAAHAMTSLSREESKCLLYFETIVTHVFLQSHFACLGVEPADSQDGSH